ncbi:DUF2267 domain-containing protein [Halarchaeum sp. P4]|uniref:DUF2267 domain-containing protein n=1 Tax=Halarchaeum sp. P4 TaxID=3421639 RepID=UPI003EBBF305
MSAFIDALERHGDFETDDEARVAARATLTVLGKRIARGEAEDVADYLPDEFADAVVPDEPAEPVELSHEEFVAQVADVASLAETESDRAYDYVEATFGALADVLPDEEFEGITSQLPPGYDRLLVEA